MQDKADELNAADGALGDGDLGITVSRGFAEAAAVDLPEDFGIAFLECSKAMQRVSASSYGTLLATAFLATAKATKGRTCLQTTEISSLVDGALAAMMARAKGPLGDKTVLDILKAIVDATSDAPPRRSLRPHAGRRTKNAGVLQGQAQQARPRPHVRRGQHRPLRSWTTGDGAHHRGAAGGPMRILRLLW
jgi:dihydroxyacetone kinase